jgi:pentatricopeptide repeat protein
VTVTLPSKSLIPLKVLNETVNYSDISLSKILNTLHHHFDTLQINSNYLLYTDLIYTKPCQEQIDVISKLTRIILERNIYCKQLDQGQLNELLENLVNLKVKGLSQALLDCIINGGGYSAGLNSEILNNLLVLMTLDNNLGKLDHIMEILQLNDCSLERLAYENIFQNLANHGRVEYIHLFYQFARSYQPELLDIDFYSKLVESYSISNRLDLAEVVISDLKSNGLKIPAEEENLFEFKFNEINRVLNYYHSTLDLLLTGRNKVNDIAKKTSGLHVSIEECRRKINEMDDIRQRPSIEDFNELIKASLNLGQLREAKWICKNFSGRRVAPNATTFELFINYYCVNKNLSRAESSFEEMLGFKILPKLEAWSILILLNCKLGNLDRVFELLERLKNSGIRMNCTLFYSLVKLLVREGKFTEALKVYMLMLDYEVPIAPGFKQRFLMQHFKLNETQHAKDLYLSITKQELLTCPNLNKTIFYGYCLFSDIQEILAYLSNWEFNYNSALTSMALNKSVDLILLRGELEWVKKVITFSLNTNGNLLNTNTFTMILQVCAGKKNYDFFDWLLGTIKRFKLEDKLEFKNYKLMVIILIDMRRHNSIVDIVNKMQQKGIALDKFLLNVYMTSLQKTQGVEQFQVKLNSVLSNLPTEFSKDTAILNEYLIKLIKYNAIEECLKLVEVEFIPNGIKLDKSIFNNLSNLVKLTNNEELINRFSVLAN